MSYDGRNMPSAARIARFWANRCLKYDAPLIHARVSRCFPWTGSCCDLSEFIFTHTYCDEAEPDCLSCGQYLGQTVVNDSPYSFGGIRAHIIPRSLGGKDAVHNILPLCEFCHELNPEQESRRIYLDWLIYRRRYVAEVRQLVIKEIASEYPVVSQSLHLDPVKEQAVIDTITARINRIIYVTREGLKS